MHKLAKRPLKDPLLGAGAQHQTPNLQKKNVLFIQFQRWKVGERDTSAQPSVFFAGPVELKVITI